jgi:glutamate-5-semialdehyde dehydrogenase
MPLLIYKIQAISYKLRKGVKLNSLSELGKKAKKAAAGLAVVSTQAKNDALLQAADDLRADVSSILAANETDMKAAKEKGTTGALLDRLMLNEDRVLEMAASLEDIAKLQDPIGEVVKGWVLPNGLKVYQIRVPLGVIGVIYEARPNVTVEAAALCIKSGNAVILRGGSLAFHSGIELAKIIAIATANAGLPVDSVQMVSDTSRQTADDLMALRDLDVLIPRGGEDLINTVVEKARVPVLWAAAGVCHTYIDKEADLEKALAIVYNAKVQRPGVCNAMETMLVHEEIADKFLPEALNKFKEAGVVIHGDEKTVSVFADAVPATEEDWKKEYLDLELAVKVVKDVDEAIAHISKYGTLHSEAIVTENYSTSAKFVDSVDAAAVYVNASTRFTDGGQFGLGAEMGISTQKMHVRGPVGLEGLTSTKYVIRGEGQIRR